MKEWSSEVVWREAEQLWWPVADREPDKAVAFVMPRVHDSDVAVNLCKQRRTCVQAGGYVGLWPRQLARSFERVLTFEVMPGCFEACSRNCAHLDNVRVLPIGLGSKNADVKIRPHVTAGSWRVDPEGELSATLVRLDYYGFTDCDAIILDVEGYEVEVLKGAAETIKRCKPVIMVEELDGSRAGIRKHLRSIGYRQAAQIRKDVVYVPI